MTALYLAPRVPLIDVRTGCATTIFYRFLTEFFATNGAGATLDANAFEVLPSAQVDSFSALLPQEGGDLSPVPMLAPIQSDDVSPPWIQQQALPDDLSPAYDMLAMIASLQAQIDDLKKGTTL
jgi:hypothetical protein